VDTFLASRDGRRKATDLVVQNFEHIPVELLAHGLLAAANCRAAEQLIDTALRDGWSLEAERIECPVRVLWGTLDRLLAWPRAATRYRGEWLPRADWVVLDGVGHYSHLDTPLETSQLILGFTRFSD
jgi:pimeloyl-ACP methyl ester carboxylesterase